MSLSILIWFPALCGLLGTVLRYPYELRRTKPYFGDIPKRKMPKDLPFPAGLKAGAEPAAEKKE